jgi:predicted transcriptional regulator
MEDGFSMKLLKRHLRTVHGISPQQYREKWGLPADYPMVASNYAKLRSSLALESGLGLKPDARAGRRAQRGRHSNRSGW